jgi:hypothetical protein
MKPKGSGGRLGDQNLCPATVVKGFEGYEGVKLALIGMNLGSPVIAIRPKALRLMENFYGITPMYQILADIGIKAVTLAPAAGTPGSVHIIFPFIGENKGIADVNLI